MLIVSLVGSQKLKYEPIFTEGRMTVYTYEGVIMTGLPESGLSRAGVRINCGLNIIPVGQNTYLLKISHVQILEYNGIWPRDSFIPSHKLTQKLAPELTKPVKFEYSNGRVGNIQAPASLLEDVLNIHRGILNIFQITMKKSQNFYGLQETLDILTHLERHNQDRIHFDTPDKFLQLVQLLRSTTEETIDTLWRKSHSLELNTRRWILFALPAVGTPAALNFLKTKIQNLDISTADIVQALVLAMHQITADHQSLSIVRELFGMNHVQQIPMLRQIVYLGYGSMVFRFCAEKETCPDSLFKPLHDLLSAAIAHANEEDIVLGLKAIGNAGQPVSIKNIMKLLPGFGTAAATIPLKVQVDAIMALRNIAKKDPGKVQAIMIQLFMNQKNHPEIRMSACAIFLAAGCNIAAKLLSPKFDRLGLRFSRMLHPDTFCCKFVARKVYLPLKQMPNELTIRET
ncbi:hypothetical protein chiPu_0017805 [Chiloscyllium punctatum]|uniref:Vitellogenin domain-containing protein n=1 Tax=Chiloscyllium punctatum TaxID=137246 RepID=A0A401RIZ4_CHIPU|nr:hypothetical protein [Chiloscyllium punctatum]